MYGEQVLSASIKMQLEVIFDSCCIQSAVRTGSHKRYRVEEARKVTYGLTYLLDKDCLTDMSSWSSPDLPEIRHEAIHVGFPRTTEGNPLCRSLHSY